MLAQAGHFDARPLLTFESRAGYSLFGTTKIESRLALQLPASFRIAASAFVNPTRLNSTDPGSTGLGVTLERVLGSRLKPESLFYLGLRSGTRTVSSNPRHENMIVVGFAKPW